jgi:hypothetical protein
MPASYWFFIVDSIIKNSSNGEIKTYDELLDFVRRSRYEKPFIYRRLRSLERYLEFNSIDDENLTKISMILLSVVNEFI